MFFQKIGEVELSSALETSETQAISDDVEVEDNMVNNIEKIIMYFS